MKKDNQDEKIELSEKNPENKEGIELYKKSENFLNIFPKDQLHIYNS